MIILRQKTFGKVKKILGYGTGYLVGGIAGNKLGESIGKKVKRDLNEKDLEEERRKSKEHRKFIEEHKNKDISEESLKKYQGNDEIMSTVDKYGDYKDDPDAINYKKANKNKNKILKESQKNKEQHDKVVANPKKYPGDYSKTGGAIGSTVGITGGLITAHKLLKKVKR